MVHRDVDANLGVSLVAVAPEGSCLSGHALFPCLYNEDDHIQPTALLSTKQANRYMTPGLKRLPRQ